MKGSLHRLTNRGHTATSLLAKTLLKFLLQNLSFLFKVSSFRRNLWTGQEQHSVKSQQIHRKTPFQNDNLLKTGPSCCVATVLTTVLSIINQQFWIRKVWIERKAWSSALNDPIIHGFVIYKCHIVYIRSTGWRPDRYKHVRSTDMFVPVSTRH